MALARFQGVFFAMSLLYINVAVASILTVLKSIVIAFLLERLFKKTERYQKITTQKWFLFALAFIGAGFVVASQSENFGTIIGDLLNTGAIIGILLVLLSVFFGAAGEPQSLKLGSVINKEKGGGSPDELFFTVAFMVVAWMVGSLLFFTAGIATKESFADINIYSAITFGVLGQLTGVIFSRLSYIKTASLGIAAIRYFAPVIALIWLGLGSLIYVPHFDWLLIGVSAIITANLLLNFKPIPVSISKH